MQSLIIIIITTTKQVITTDGITIANHFNKFVISIAHKLIKKIPQTNRAYHNPNKKSFIMHPTNPYDIEEVIKSLKLNKAIGPNNIPPVTLRNSLIRFVSLLTNTFWNESFQIL